MAARWQVEGDVLFTWAGGSPAILATKEDQLTSNGRDKHSEKSNKLMQD
jgi:hypothetical protein